MKLYHFHDPQEATFAKAGRVGTWNQSGSNGACPECGRSRAVRVSPLVIEWLPGSAAIGDFVWPGMDDELVAGERVKEALESRFGGFEFMPLEMYQDPKLHRPKRLDPRTRPRVWLPYEGPPLYELKPVHVARLDHSRSSVSKIGDCKTCGRPRFETPPFDERHLVVDRASLGGSAIFGVMEYPRWIFCTEEMKDFLESKDFSNLAFLYDGEISS